jgi:hypothetical protein
MGGNQFLSPISGAPGGIRTHNRLIRRNGIPPLVVAGMLGHSISILLNTYAHYIPTMQDQAAQPARKSSSLGFAAKYAAQLMHDILMPIPFEMEAKR